MKIPTHINIQKIEIDWSKISQNLLSIIWQLATTSLIFYLLSHFGHKIINNYSKKHLFVSLGKTAGAGNKRIKKYKEKWSA